MKYGSFKGKHREPVPGRKLIIVIVVLTSALSFTLGYFVGKAVLKEKQPQSQIIAMLPQQKAEPALQEQPVQNNEQSIVNIPQPSINEGKPLSDKGLPVQTTAAKKETAVPVIKENRPVQNTAIYTVQAGAFKNLKDAEALKRKLENKGYQVYIKKSMEAKNTKLFKVRTGEFTDKAKAEAVALKLKKAGGLKTFVTSKNEEAHDEGKNPPRAAKQENPR